MTLKPYNSHIHKVLMALISTTTPMSILQPYKVTKNYLYIQNYDKNFTPLQLTKYAQLPE